jgi:hypothetical protein
LRASRALRSLSKLEPAPPDPDALRFLDQAAYGFGRTVDHALWKENAESATLWLAGGEPASYSYVSAAGLIGTSIAIPGSSAKLVEVALASGLHLKDPGLLLLWPPVDPPRALAIHSDWLL